MKQSHIVFADVFEAKDLENKSISKIIAEAKEDFETEKAEDISNIINPVKITIDIIITTQELGITDDKS